MLDAGLSILNKTSRIRFFQSSIQYQASSRLSPEGEMSRLFESATIGSMRLRNRFVRSATWEGMATPEGVVTSRMVETIVALAKGGVGLIISGHAFVQPEGQAGPYQMSAHTDGCIPGLTQLATAAHEHGAKMVLQLAHAGYLAATHLTGLPPLAVSAAVTLDDIACREATAADIRGVVRAFAAAALRARQAGFDGVQIHSAHGYFLNQFLSPLFNQRPDEYGGSLQNRARVHIEILQAIRQAVGSDYPVLIKMNGSDFAEGGLMVSEAAEAAALMEAAGLDAVEVSGGMARFSSAGAARQAISNQKKEAYHQDQARVFKQRLTVPLILVGGIRSLPVAERLVQEGICDFISMSRPFIREPDLVSRWQSGDRRKAACTSDNLCFGPARSGNGIYCVTAARAAGRRGARGRSARGDAEKA
jgi:2,4-dienoyl-CoA reductase-like NADH-dependent reductase (Old Yellow Enzyme family)